MPVNGEGDALHLKGVFIHQVNSCLKGWFQTQQEASVVKIVVRGHTNDKIPDVKNQTFISHSYTHTEKKA